LGINAMYRTPLPPVEYILSCFDYNRELGKLHWKAPTGRRAKVGDHAGYLNSGYYAVKLNKKTYLVHRLIWKIEHKEDPPAIIDHIDRITTNNVITNLRAATQSENQLNRDSRGHGAAGIKGVTWSKMRKKWCASIRIDKKTYFLGRFDNIHDAKNAYIKSHPFPQPQDVKLPEGAL
jgi:hypothetical protein